ncbi:hypothetical protein LR48_Vigan08g005600 [Vigna angularis]|uniref:Uncharacterized protein n=1 Tax=Phaseolus angularis TaxID=3914 RepID=A0A0L9V3B1_PHAAN|nr:hypothetical protein LR48_Vigan08g005600 [Vigna angularis]
MSFLSFFAAEAFQWLKTKHLEWYFFSVMDRTASMDRTARRARCRREGKLEGGDGGRWQRPDLGAWRGGGQIWVHGGGSGEEEAVDGGGKIWVRVAEEEAVDGGGGSGEALDEGGKCAAGSAG